MPATNTIAGSRNCDFQALPFAICLPKAAQPGLRRYAENRAESGRSNTRIQIEFRQRLEIDHFDGDAEVADHFLLFQSAYRLIDRDACQHSLTVTRSCQNRTSLDGTIDPGTEVICDDLDLLLQI